MKRKTTMLSPVQNRTSRFTGRLASSLLGLVTFFAFTANAQTTVFTESIGSVGATTTIAAHETANGFDNDAFTMTGSADIRNTLPSSGYIGASGLANVFVTNTNGTFFQIAGVNTTTLSGLSLSFGIFKSTTTSNGSDFIVEVSADGVSYSPLSVPALPTGSGTAVWASRTATGSIPSTSNLRIRFRQTGSTTQYRVDDVRLTSVACPNATISPAGTIAICAGTSTTLTASAGLSYLWSTGATTQSISVSTAGSYSVTVTSAGSCVSTSPATVVTVTPLPSAVVTANGPTTFCNGGSVVLTAAEVGASYVWSNGATTQSITVFNSGTFSVVVTKNSCSATSAPIAVTENALPIATITANGSVVICSGESVQLSANTAAAYLWSTGDTTQSILASVSGGYTVQVTDSNGCVSLASAPQDVYVRLLPIIVASVDTAICAGSSTTLSANVYASDLFISEYVEGNGNNKYIEIYNGTATAINLNDYRLQNYSNGNNTPNFNNLLSGILAPGQTVVYRDALATAYAGAATPLTSVVFNGNDAVVLFKVSANAAVDIIGRIADNPGTAWTTTGLSTLNTTLRRKSTITGGVTVNPTATGSGAFLTLGSDWNAFATDDVSDLGSHAITGNFTWSPAASLNTATASTVVATPSETTTYTVSGAFACTNSDQVTVTVVPNPLATLVASDFNGSNISCNGGNNGSIDLTVTEGVAPYNYIWSNGATTEDISGLTAGTYSVQISDATYGCSTTASITLTEPTVLVASSTQDAAIACNGGTTTVTVVADGGTASYSGIGTFTVVAGTYSYTVTDANGCVATTSIVVSEPTVLIASSTQGAAIACNGGTTTVTVVADGGTTPYSGVGTFTVVAGAYSYTVTDANGCVATTSIVVSEPTVLVASSTQGTAIACNGGTTTVTVVADGGTAPYSGVGTFTVVAGTYSYTVTDANGCVATTSIVVSEPTVLVSAIAQNGPIACFGGTTTVTVSANGGTTPYSGVGTFTVSAGTSSFTVTDANGCTSSVSIIVTQPATPVSVSIAPLVLDRCGRDIQITRGYGSQSVQLSSSATGGTPTYTYSWSPATGLNNASIANPVASPTTTTTYTVTATDSKGCTATSSVTVNVLDVRCGTLLGQQLVTICNPVTVINLLGIRVTTQQQLCVTTGVAATTLALNPNACLGACSSLRSGEIEDAESIETVAGVSAYPNPFTDNVTIAVNFPNATEAVLEIVDVLGKKVAETRFDLSESANQQFVWNGVDIAGNSLNNGVYFCKVNAGNETQTVRIVLQK